ncbi:MazG nucleotide pyrophosphohydrolase domain-containing protein [Radiobacillus deserti]|uniref:MazG nucleotide pyrophosphohydrolase domain-containing protein n=1 Tax=Radiobacillus deserti TaxID=2594883 RepID=UPI001E5FFD98|nr:MazG nucleotide pyrophosphohydrolase domain-containing protein [Radiobacillus deserti]
MDEDEAFEAAKDGGKGNIGKELADCIAYITMFANYFEVDLEDSFYQKMEEVRNRKNRDVGV